MTGMERWLVGVIWLITLLYMAEMCTRKKEKETETACESACAPMAYTGFRDEGGCWCRAEDPNTLKREK